MTVTPEHHMVIHSILPDTLWIDSCHHFTPRTTNMLSFYGTNLKVLGRKHFCSPDPHYVIGSGELPTCFLNYTYPQLQVACSSGAILYILFTRPTSGSTAITPITLVTDRTGLQNNSPGHSKSKEMAPNESPYVTSYPSLVISLVISTSLSKLQPSEICMTSI